MTKTYEVKTLGSVKQDEKGFFLEIDKEYQKALLNIEGFSHLNVLWWATEFDDETYRSFTVSKKPYKKGPDQLGMFATRSPIRPNPICLSIVQVLFIEENKVYVPYIDAYVDTPIIDIKPYHMCTDKLEQAQVPKWCQHWPKCYEDSGQFDWESEFENA